MTSKQRRDLDKFDSPTARNAVFNHERIDALTGLPSYVLYERARHGRALHVTHMYEKDPATLAEPVVRRYSLDTSKLHAVESSQVLSTLDVLKGGAVEVGTRMRPVSLDTYEDCNVDEQEVIWFSQLER